MKLTALVLLITLGLVMLAPMSYGYALSDKKALKQIDKEIKDIPGKVEDIDSIIAFEGDKAYVVWGEDIQLPPLTEICGDGLDNDLDGLVDENCAPVEICGDGIDNDGDGLIDEDCTTQEICGDGIDNNGNGQIDENCPPPVEICGDGIDNDGDGLIDEDCPPPVEICGNGKDDDGDGQIDEDCVEICGDGIDNNGNGQIDEGCPIDNGFKVLPNKTLEFITMGDWGNTGNTEKNIANMKSIPKDSKLYLGLGDYDYDDNLSDEWLDKYFNQLNYPKHYVQGNHDSDNAFSKLGQSGWNTKSTHANLQVFDFNTENSMSGQGAKAATAFAGNDASVFEVITMHKPPATLNTKHGPQSGTQEQVCEAKKSADVDLVLAGHNHNYQQSKLLKCDSNDRWIPATDPNDPANFMYFLVGGGGRDLYSMSGSNVLIDKSDRSFGFLDIQINENYMLSQYVKSDKTINFPLTWKFN